MPGQGMVKLIDTNPYSALILNALVKAQYGYGVVVGGKIAVGSGDAVNCAPGIATRNGELIPIRKMTNISLGMRDATYPKRGVIYVDESAVDVKVSMSAAASAPDPPALPGDDDILLAIVKLPKTGGGAFTLEDCRVKGKLWEKAFRDDFQNIDTNYWTEKNYGVGDVTCQSANLLRLDTVDLGSSNKALLVGITYMKSTQYLQYMRVRYKLSDADLGLGWVYIGFAFPASEEYFTANFYALHITGTGAKLRNKHTSVNDVPCTGWTNDTNWHYVDIFKTKIGASTWETVVILDDDEDTYFFENSIYVTTDTVIPAFKVGGGVAAIHIDIDSVLFALGNYS